MKNLESSLTQPRSLGDQVSSKISAWVFILVVSVITVIFCISFFLSCQMFNQQVRIWDEVAPQQSLASLIDSDDFSIKNEVAFLKSTGLFSTFLIADNKKRVIAYFGDKNINGGKLIPIKDNARIIWGYYYFESDFYHFIAPFFIAAVLFLMIIYIVYLIVRWRMKISLNMEFSRFNNFLLEIERVTVQLHEFCIKDGDKEFELTLSENHEQVIINRAINRLLDEIKRVNESLRVAIVESEQRRFQEELTKTALQVVHDIGSPIAILQIIESKTQNIPEENRVLIRNAIQRIRDISNTLLKKAKYEFAVSKDDKKSLQLLLFIIEQVVSEKRIQFKDKTDIIFEPGLMGYHLFSYINPSELSRVLSNLINNAVEAIQNNKEIVVSLMNVGSEVLIQIEDFGLGIPEHILSKLGTLGNSFGKMEGTGVGLNHAFNAVKSWGGRVQIMSERGQGTRVQLIIPKLEPPKWFIPEIKADQKTIVIIDDDESIHALWKSKFQSLICNNNDNPKLVHLFSPEELIYWKEQSPNNLSVLYLCDYEFIGSELNGIDLIKKLKINHQSVLVTSRIVEDIVLGCESVGIRLLPKNIVKNFPVS